MPKKHSASINLLKGAGDNFFDRFIDWALTIGRLLVILTEIVALSSFIYRFTLDRQLIDLHSKIKQEENVISVLKDKENTYRNLQDRIRIASTFSSTQNGIEIIKDVLGFAPSGMSFNNLSITENSISIAATFQSASSLGTFINSIKNYDPIKNVSIDKIDNKLSNAQIVAAITASLVDR